MNPVLPPHARGVGAAPPPDPRAQLEHMAHALEGMFLNQMFQAMRQTVPEDQAETPGREIMQSMLDERLADTAAQRMHRGIGDALYRQLARRLGPEPAAPAGAPDAGMPGAAAHAPGAMPAKAPAPLQPLRPVPAAGATIPLEPLRPVSAAGAASATRPVSAVPLAPLRPAERTP